MNKYQKQINKITRNYINIQKENYKKNNAKTIKFSIDHSQNDINAYKIFNITEYWEAFNSNWYYCRFRKKIRKQMKWIKETDKLKFQREYECIWIGGKKLDEEKKEIINISNS